MRKKRGILGKIVIAVIVLGIIGAVSGGKDELTKENPALERQEQLAQEILTAPKAEAPKAETQPAKPAAPKAEAPKEETQPTKPAEPEKKQSSGIRKELKDFLDSYESFMDEYCEFMENYNASDMTMLTQYMQLLSKYNDFAQKADEWQNEDMNDEELLYYAEVLNRVSAKLLKASQNMM